MHMHELPYQTALPVHIWSLQRFLTGTRDLLVLPELNALVGVWPEEMVVEADVRDMTGVWLSADHQVTCLSVASISQDVCHTCM